MSNTNQHGLKRQKLGLFAVIGMIYSLTAAGAWGMKIWFREQALVLH